jgi:hypothetical protein
MPMDAYHSVVRHASLRALNPSSPFGILRTSREVQDLRTALIQVPVRLPSILPVTVPERRTKKEC